MSLEVLEKSSSKPLKKKKKIYIPVKIKFTISITIAIMWMILSIYLSIPWVKDLSIHVALPLSIMIIAGIAYIPGYMNAFMVSSLLLDRQPPLKSTNPTIPITILIACYNEEKAIMDTIKHVSIQDYNGQISVIVINNNSNDRTVEAAQKAGLDMNVDVLVIHEPTPGKSYALNSALDLVKTEYILTLDADTLLHKSAIRNIISRMLTSPQDVCAIAGTVLVRTSRFNLLAKIQEWDYFLGIASIKRLQGLFQGTLVAQGAFSMYKTYAVKYVGGWPDAIGEDIVLTWKFLGNNWKVYFEPLSVAFTDVPLTLKHFSRQRSRWARGMIEALKTIKPWNQPSNSVKYLTSCNMLMPYLDIVYTLCWVPGIVLALFGYYWIVGLATLFVLPLALLQNYILYCYQKKIFSSLNLKIRKNIFGFIVYVFFYQIISSPVALWGYIQEALKLNRVWK